jgi:DNA-binding beta-propeller fold protein YncE
VVADRGSATLTVIDVDNDKASTVAMPAGAKTPEPMYVVFTPVRNRLFVGDRANNRIVVFNPKDFSVEKEVPTGAGIWHMWASELCLQLWIVNDVDKTMTVVDTASLNVVATIPLPADLVAMGGRPHDVILDPTAPFAYVTMIGFPGLSDYVIKYSTTTLAEVGRQQVGKDPHLSLTWRNPLLYVPCQNSGQVFVLDRRTLTVMPSIPVPGAHGAGMALSGQQFYTTDFTSTSANGLYAIDTGTNQVVGRTDTPFSTPHNIAVTSGGRKIYVTHSGANSNVSVYVVNRQDPTPRFFRTVATGQNPFGLAFVPGKASQEPDID